MESPRLCQDKQIFFWFDTFNGTLSFLYYHHHYRGHHLRVKQILNNSFKTFSEGSLKLYIFTVTKRFCKLEKMNTLAYNKVHTLYISNVLSNRPLGTYSQYFIFFVT
jgi:hypothetical protein